MAATKDLTVRLIGKDQGALQALTGLGKKADETGKKTEGMSKLATSALVGLGAAAAGAALKSAATFEKVGGEVLKLQRYTGESAEQMSRLRFAAQQSGTDIDTLTKSIGIASKNFEKSSDTMKDFGVATKAADGSARPMTAVLLDMADRFKGMPNGAEKTALAMKTFGRAGADMIPFLNRGSEGLSELMAKTDEYGLVLGSDALDAVKKSKAAHRDLDAALEGLQVRIGGSVLPVLTTMTTTLAKIPGPVADIIGPVAVLGGGLLGLAVVGGKVAGALGPAVTKLRDLNAASAEAGGRFSSLGSKIAATAGIVTAAAVGFELIQARMKQGEQAVNGLTAALDKTRAGAKTMADLDRQLDSTQKQIAGLGTELENSHNPMDIFYREDLGNGIVALQRASIETNILKAAVQAYAQTHGVSNDAALKAVLGQQEETRAQRELKDATEGTTEVIDEQNRALRASVDPLFASQEALMKNKDAQREAADAGRDLWNAQVAYNQQVAIWGANSPQAVKAWNDLQEATRKKADADTAVTKSSLDLEVAQAKLSYMVGINANMVGEARNKLNEWVTAGWMTRAEADAQIIKWYQAADAANGYSTALSGLRAKVPQEVLTGVNAVLHRQTPIGGARASGGPVTGGVPYLVGERGPELFTPGASGNITANGRFEDGSRYGMSPAEKAALAYAKYVQKQEYMRANPNQQFSAGWGTLATNPFAGWDPNADFSNWGKPAPARPATFAGRKSAAGDVNITVKVDATASDGRAVGAAVVNALLELQRTSPGGIQALVRNAQ